MLAAGGRAREAVLNRTAFLSSMLHFAYGLAETGIKAGQDSWTDQNKARQNIGSKT